jgi:hypothetical protein
MPRTSPAVYLYVLVRSDRPPSLAGAPAGLPGTGPLRLIPAGPRLWLVAADAPLARYGEEPIARGLKDLDWVAERAVAHEGVVRHFARRRNAVPMRLFTLFSADERAQEHVRRQQRRLTRVLTRVEGCEEWGVRLFADDAPPPRAKVRPTADDAGRRFLEHKRAQHRTARRVPPSTAKAALSMVRELGRVARDLRRHPVPAAASTSRMLVDAAFLVPQGSRPRFRAVLARAASGARSQGLRVTVTGPWPPYNFVDDASAAKEPS